MRVAAPLVALSCALAIGFLPLAKSSAQSAGDPAAIPDGARLKVTYQGAISGTATVKDRSRNSSVTIGGFRANIEGTRNIPVQAGYTVVVTYEGATFTGVETQTSDQAFLRGTFNFRGVRQGNSCSVTYPNGTGFTARCTQREFTYDQSMTDPSGQKAVLHVASTGTQVIDLVEQERQNAIARAEAERQRAAEQAEAARRQQIAEQAEAARRQQEAQAALRAPPKAPPPPAVQTASKSQPVGRYVPAKYYTDPHCIKASELGVEHAEESGKEAQKGLNSQDSVCAYALALIYEARKDYGTAMTYYRSAADSENALAANNLGGLYGNGWGVARDPEQALAWHERALNFELKWRQSDKDFINFVQENIRVDRDNIAQRNNFGRDSARDIARQQEQNRALNEIRARGAIERTNRQTYCPGCP